MTLLSRRTLTGSLALPLAAPFLVREARAQAQPLKALAFAGASNWPIWAGQAQGLFAKHGVEVALEFTPNSRVLARRLHEGTTDLALTSIDNILAYNAGQGEEPLGATPDFVAMFGVDDGLLSVMAQPEIADLKGLAGKKVSVDAMSTGFAFVLRDILGREGVEKDVTFEAVGGGAQRLAALLEGKQAATLLNTPLDLAAAARGMKRLVRARDVIGPYQGICGAARRDRVAEMKPRLVGFMRGFQEAVAWCANPGNRDAAIDVFLEKQQGTARPVAANAHAALFDAERGIFRDLRIDEPGLNTVIELRRRFAGDPGPASRHLDLSLRREALQA